MDRRARPGLSTTLRSKTRSNDDTTFEKEPTDENLCDARKDGLGGVLQQLTEQDWRAIDYRRATEYMKKSAKRGGTLD